MTQGHHDHALLQRVADTSRPSVAFVLDGKPCTALQGDTVLTAVLTRAAQLRRNEFSGTPRAGFCLMGACQDCWVQTAEGARLRACSTFVEAGMHIVTDLAGSAA